MSNFIHDSINLHWTIMAPHRASRPSDFGGKNDMCPFCPGNEATTPPEVYRTGEGDSDKPGWQIRVTPNKYPLTSTHEVIIHSPDHTPLLGLSPEQVEGIFQVFRSRYQQHKKEGTVLIFSNQGEIAGSSIAHPHTQLVVLPPNVPLKTLPKQPVTNTIQQTDYFSSYCPDYSEWPYEVWIAPTRESNSFENITDVEIEDLSAVFLDVLKRLDNVRASNYSAQKELNYNFYISPFNDWYLRVIPRFVQRAGFELGSGIMVNEVGSSEAFQVLKK